MRAETMPANLLLVCRQFGAESRESASPHTSLTMTETGIQRDLSLGQSRSVRVDIRAGHVVVADVLIVQSHYACRWPRIKSYGSRSICWLVKLQIWFNTSHSCSNYCRGRRACDISRNFRFVSTRRRSPFPSISWGPSGNILGLWL